MRTGCKAGLDYFTKWELEMTGEFPMSTSDLILCSNLLQADANRWKAMATTTTEGATAASIYASRAGDREGLAARMIAEVDARSKAALEGPSARAVLAA